MDSVTHIIVGAAIGDSLLRKKIGRWGAVAGAFLNTFPDLDLLVSGLTDAKKYIVFHRAHTHALFYQFFYCFALAALFYYLFKKKHVSYTYWLVVALANVFSHSLMDICTNYGTRLFLPFSRELVAFNNMAILDLVLTLPILLLLIIGISFRNNSPYRQSFISILLLYTIGYFSYSFVNKAVVNRVFEQSVKDNQIRPTRFMSNPTILNNFLWYAIATNEDSLYITEYSLLSKNKQLRWTGFARHAELKTQYGHQMDIKLLDWFSQGFNITEQDGDTLNYYAVKFGRNNFTASDAKHSFIFHYKLYKGPTKWEFGSSKPSDMNESFLDAFKLLVHKIRGN